MHILLLSAFLILVAPHPSLTRITVYDSHKLSRQLQRRRLTCIQEPSGSICNGRTSPGPGLDPENCVHLCLSPACYKQVYEAEPVSFGLALGHWIATPPMVRLRG